MLDNRILTFLKLCEKMNYTKTAEALHITQPAVTQHIRFLEEHYGCKLFSYTGKVLHLTEKGELLRRLASEMVANEMGVQKEMARKEEEEIHLRVGATTTIGEFVFPSIMSRFLKENPQYRLHLYVDNTKNLLQMLEKGELDFTILEGFFDKENYAYQLYKKERFVGTCCRECELAGKRLKLGDIRSEGLVLREEGSGTREILEEILKENNFTIGSFPSVQEISNFIAIKELVKANLGITFSYYPMVRQELEEGSLVELDIEDFEIYREFNYVYMKNSLFEEKYQKLIDFAKEIEA